MSLWGQQLLCWGASCQKYFIMKVQFLSRPFIINSHRCRGALNTDPIYCTNWHIINHKSHASALLLYLAFQHANSRESFNLCVARMQKVNSGLAWPGRTAQSSSFFEGHCLGERVEDCDISSIWKVRHYAPSWQRVHLYKKSKAFILLRTGHRMCPTAAHGFAPDF